MFNTLLPLIFSGATTPEERICCLLLFIFFLDLIASLIRTIVGGVRSK